MFVDVNVEIFVVVFTYTYGTRLRYMMISVNLTFDAENIGYPTGLPIRNRWEEFAKEEV